MSDKFGELRILRIPRWHSRPKQILRKKQHGEEELNEAHYFVGNDLILSKKSFSTWLNVRCWYFLYSFVAWSMACW